MKKPACAGVIAALANAVYDATGVRLNRLPLTPERVLSGIKALQEQDANSRP